MTTPFLSRRLLPLTSLIALLAVHGTGCRPEGTEPEDAVDEPTERTSETEQALRTPGSLAKYFHVSTGQAITEEAEYSTWSARWHTIMRGRVENELFFYDRIDGTAKTYTMQDDGTLVHKNTQTVSTGVDTWVRGNFLGTSAKELASYDRDTGVVNVYEVLTTGALTFRFSKTVAAGYALAFTGFWGNGACDDIVFYDRATGGARYYESDGSSTFTLAHTASWQKTWDYIVPGRFNTDGFTDLLYYNQDGGDVKVFTLDANRNGTQTYSATNWPITPFSTVTVGEFGGSTQTDDVVVYDPRNGWNPTTTTSGASGRGRFYTSSTSGVLSLATTYTNWQKKWTHVTAIKQPSRSTHDLLFYSMSYDVEVAPVKVADTNGANGVDLDVADFQRWLNVANETYRGAGIQFVWNGGFQTLNNTSINGYQCSGDPEWLKDYADTLATGTYGAPDKVVIFIRESGGGDGCGSPDREYMIMPDFNGTSTTYFHRDGSSTDSFGGSPPANDNIKLFAHEVGHYLGLGHTYWDGAASGLPSSLANMDVDRGGGSWSVVYDTSPTPNGDYWSGTDPGCDGVGEACDGTDFFRCDDTSAGEITYPLSGGGSLTLNPDRHNVMLNGVNCDFVYNLTPGQIDAVRKNLFTNRVELTD